jgi:FtsH-binding integral membrane protein
MICYVPERIDRLANTIITAVIFALLVLPMVAMYELSRGDQRSSPLSAFGILILFTLLFCVTMHSLTRATRQELFAAPAAYCAVLVVFISNFNTQTV